MSKRENGACMHGSMWPTDYAVTDHLGRHARPESFQTRCSMLVVWGELCGRKSVGDVGITWRDACMQRGVHRGAHARGGMHACRGEPIEGRMHVEGCMHVEGSP
eukprot:363224-Chlamydomonas_euryale.AAC.6